MKAMRAMRGRIEERGIRGRIEKRREQ